MNYDDIISTYDGAPTDAFLARLLAAVEGTPAAVLVAAQLNPIHADTRQMNGAAVQGDGTEANKWRGNV